MKKIILGGILCILMIFGLVGGILNEPADPMSAEGMTVEERLKNDMTVLLEELDPSKVKTIEIDYGVAAIKVYLNKKSIDQYVEDDARTVKSDVYNILLARRGDLTFDKDSYNIFIYGDDNRLIFI